PAPKACAESVRNRTKRRRPRITRIPRIAKIAMPTKQTNDTNQAKPVLRESYCGRSRSFRLRPCPSYLVRARRLESLKCHQAIASAAADPLQNPRNPRMELMESATWKAKPRRRSGERVGRRASFKFVVSLV